MSKRRISRRRFLENTGTVLAVATAAPESRKSIQLTVNGASHRLAADDRWTLAELLRDHLDLTGTKIGCDRGECGACTVLLDGKPVYSCSQLAVWADGRSVQTVEGLMHGDMLHPVQQAFIDHDAPQCGFCTSGQLMSASALVAANAHPTPDEARAAMTGNICRCSGYNHYVAAVVGVSIPPTLHPEIPALRTVGNPTPRLDAVERTTGRATYTCDVKLPGMLYARVLRSPHPHARITRIDASKALALAGVRAIITHENCAV